MNSEDLRQLRPPQVLESYPEALKKSLRALQQATERNDGLGSATAVQQALEFLLTYFTSVSTGLLVKLEPGRPEVTALAGNVDSLLQMERLLRFSLSTLENFNHHAPLKVRRVFFLNARSNLPFSHTRWLRISGTVDPGLMELSQWVVRLESLRASQDHASAAQDAARYSDLLKTWLEGAQPFFDYWIHDYQPDRVTLVAEGFEFKLVPDLAPQYRPNEPTPGRRVLPSPEPSVSLPRPPIKLELGKAPEPSSRLEQFRERLSLEDAVIKHPFAELIAARIEYLTERSDTVPDQLFERMNPTLWEPDNRVAVAAPWSADEVEAFEELLLTTYPHVDEELLPTLRTPKHSPFPELPVAGLCPDRGGTR